jgi:hypothetical protein
MIAGAAGCVVGIRFNLGRTCVIGRPETLDTHLRVQIAKEPLSFHINNPQSMAVVLCVLGYLAQSPLRFTLIEAQSRT